MNNQPDTAGNSYPPYDPVAAPPKTPEDENKELAARLKSLMDQADGQQADVTTGKWKAAPGFYPSYGDKEKNERLLLDIDCVKDLDSDEYILVVKAGLRIGKRDILLTEKQELSESLMKRIKKLRDKLDETLKNKATLIGLLK